MPKKNIIRNVKKVSVEGYKPSKKVKTLKKGNMKDQNFIDYVFSLNQIDLDIRHEICRLYIRDRQKDLNDYKNSIKGDKHESTNTNI